MPEPDYTQRGYAAIGRVCTIWSDLEWHCQRVAETAAPFLAVDLERDDARFVLIVALAHMDIRNKIATAKVFVEQAPISSKIKQQTVKVLNRIDNELRLERNRFIHDEWIVSKHRAARTTLRPKVVKRQARQSSLVTAQTKIFSNEELEQFGDLLWDTLNELLELTDSIQAEFDAAAPALRSARQADAEKAS